MMAVPRPLLDTLDLRAGVSVGLSVESGRLIVEPSVRPRYTLEDLLADSDPDAPRDIDEDAWLSDGPVGRERL
jgi:antitoxin ChpS